MSLNASRSSIKPSQHAASVTRVNDPRHVPLDTYPGHCPLMCAITSVPRPRFSRPIDSRLHGPRASTCGQRCTVSTRTVSSMKLLKREVRWQIHKNTSERQPPTPPRESNGEAKRATRAPRRNRLASNLARLLLLLDQPLHPVLQPLSSLSRASLDVGPPVLAIGESELLHHICCVHSV